MRIVLCILTRNERESLQVTLPTLPRPGSTSGYDDMVAVDGGSTDGTCELFRAHGIHVISQPNRGRGDAMLTAIRQLPADAYIFFSPDGNEDVDDLTKFRSFLEQGFDLVIASRMMKGAKNEEDDRLLRWRKWANLAFNLAANLLFRKTGPFVTDSINGYRAITRAAANKLALDAVDYTIEYQMTIRALRHSLRIVEFPTQEKPRIAGETQARSIPTGIRFLRRLAQETSLAMRDKTRR